MIARALLDQGSVACFVTEAVAQRLKLRKQTTDITVTGLGKCEVGTPSGMVNLMLQSMNEDSKLHFDAYVMKTLTEFLPAMEMFRSQWDHLERLTLADPKYFEPGKIDLLLGANVYANILRSGLRKGPRGSPIAQETALGWILSGEIRNINGSVVAHTTITSLNTHINLDEQLKRFWELEEGISNRRRFTREEQQCENFWQSTTLRDANGRYVTRLPFINPEDGRHFGKSRDLAIARLMQLEKRFERQPELKREYSKDIDEYLSLGHMAKSDKSEQDTTMQIGEQLHYRSVYLPHHAVVKESSSSTKVRVVFDASLRTKNGKSLNESLLIGPTLQDDLVAIILRWRKHRIAFTADVKMVYRQIMVHSEDTDYQRIVWRNEPHSPIIDFKLLTVTFGTASAPYVAIKTLQRLAKDEMTKFPVGAEAVLNDFYVDDILSGADSTADALLKQNELRALLATGGFDLRKWSSNRVELLNNLPDGYVETNLPLNINLDTSVKTLGVKWHPLTDEFGFKVQLDSLREAPTKRNILSDICKLFDPLG